MDQQQKKTLLRTINSAKLGKYLYSLLVFQDHKRLTVNLLTTTGNLTLNQSKGVQSGEQKRGCFKTCMTSRGRRYARTGKAVQLTNANLGGGGVRGWALPPSVVGTAEEF